MATLSYSQSAGRAYYQVTTAAGGVISDDAVLTLDYAAIPNKQTALLLLEQFKEYISLRDWPPA